MFQVESAGSWQAQRNICILLLLISSCGREHSNWLHCK